MILRNIEDLEKHLQLARKDRRKIGFVPTMGALHQGHIKLVQKAKKECDLIIVSIFVNPTQFNNPKDLELYPRKEKADLALLKENSCDFVFIPSVEEIYPKDYQNIEIELGSLEDVMEGKHRLGHFSGVVNVVSRLFSLIQPDIAYFGRKDFQQVAVIKEMNRQLHFPIKIISIDIKRETSGLAMSSRNLRLSEQDKEKAVLIYKTLNMGREWVKTYSPIVTRNKMEDYFKRGVLKLEYLEIVHPETLHGLSQNWVPGATACIAAYCGEVRLIDNMELIAL